MHRPGFYAERFQRFMCNTVFKKVPCKWLLPGGPQWLLCAQRWGTGHLCPEASPALPTSRESCCPSLCQSLSVPVVSELLLSPGSPYVCH